MKIYIVQELNQYSIYKVSDQLVNNFEDEKGKTVVVESKSISDALSKFAVIEKVAGMEFNSGVVKYKLQQREVLEENKMKSKTRISL
jgi:hypothetical protein